MDKQDINSQSKGVMGRLGFSPIGTDPDNGVVTPNDDIAVIPNRMDDVRKKLKAERMVFVLPHVVGTNDSDFDIRTVSTLQEMLTPIFGMKVDEDDDDSRYVLISVGDLRLCYLLVQLSGDISIDIIVVKDFKGCDYSEAWMSNFSGYESVSYLELLEDASNQAVNESAKMAIDDKTDKPLFSAKPKQRDSRPFNETKVNFVDLSGPKADTPSNEMDESGDK